MATAWGVVTTSTPASGSDLAVADRVPVVHWIQLLDEVGADVGFGYLQRQHKLK